MTTRYDIRDRHGRYYVLTDDGHVRWEPWPLGEFGSRADAEAEMARYAWSTRRHLRVVTTERS